MANSIKDRSEILFKIGDRLQKLGFCESASLAFRKGGDLKRAIDVCVVLNRWDLAMELASDRNFPQMDVLLQRHIQRHIRERRPLVAFQIARKAGRHLEASKIVLDIAQSFDLEVEIWIERELNVFRKKRRC